MKKFNYKFNNAYSRFSFWDVLTQQLAGFENLLKPKDILTHEDRIALKEIHSLLYQCSINAKERKIAHQKKMHDLREEIKK